MGGVVEEEKIIGKTSGRFFAKSSAKNVCEFGPRDFERPRAVGERRRSYGGKGVDGPVKPGHDVKRSEAPRSKSFGSYSVIYRF
jgi:hypothetical protein